MDKNTTTLSITDDLLSIGAQAKWKMDQLDPVKSHVGLPPGPGLNVPRVMLAATHLSCFVECGDDADYESLATSQEGNLALANYADALIQLAELGTREQMIRHLQWVAATCRRDAKTYAATLDAMKIGG